MTANKLTREEADSYEAEMRRLESEDTVSKHELRLYMQLPMACGHAVGNLLTCDSPPWGCVICNSEADKMTDREIIEKVKEKLRMRPDFKSQVFREECINEALALLEQLQDQEASEGMAREYHHASDCNPKPWENDCRCGLLQRVRGDKAELAPQLAPQGGRSAAGEFTAFYWQKLTIEPPNTAAQVQDMLDKYGKATFWTWLQNCLHKIDTQQKEIEDQQNVIYNYDSQLQALTAENAELGAEKVQLENDALGETSEQADPPKSSEQVKKFLFHEDVRSFVLFTDYKAVFARLHAQQQEIEKLQVDKQANAREIHCIANLNHGLNKQIDRLTVENASQAERIKKLEKDKSEQIKTNLGLLETIKVQADLIEKLEKVVSLLNSMVEGKEDHSAVSRQMVEQALSSNSQSSIANSQSKGQALAPVGENPDETTTADEHEG